MRIFFGLIGPGHGPGSAGKCLQLIIVVLQYLSGEELELTLQIELWQLNFRNTSA